METVKWKRGLVKNRIPNNGLAYEKRRKVRMEQQNIKKKFAFICIALNLVPVWHNVSEN